MVALVEIARGKAGRDEGAQGRPGEQRQFCIEWMGCFFEQECADVRRSKARIGEQS
jgi:hypothetical protein